MEVLQSEYNVSIITGVMTKEQKDSTSLDEANKCFKSGT